jgi:hypothetical protein
MKPMRKWLRFMEGESDDKKSLGDDLTPPKLWTIMEFLLVAYLFCSISIFSFE